MKHLYFQCANWNLFATFTSDDTCQELVLPPEIMETYAAAEKHLDNGDLQLSVRPGVESCGFHLIFSKQPDTTTVCTDDN